MRKYKNLVLRDAATEDASILGNWWRDGKIMEHAGFPLGIKITDDKIIKNLKEKSSMDHGIQIIEVDNLPIGEMSYRRCENNTAEIGIKICDFSMQGKGYGPMFLRMLIDELFYVYYYDRIILDTNLNNIRAQHTYEKIGFTKVRIRKDAWVDQLGNNQSSVDYELLKKEYSYSFE